MKFILRLFSRFKKKIRQISSNFCILKFFLFFLWNYVKNLCSVKFLNIHNIYVKKIILQKKIFLYFFFPKKL
ncbi:hypothetical protein CPARA_1gp097 (nucleomorph) [Cryptomonas paramecium]|uniref:Uncharacterized protein n=1 Tax=Cryptomonas paramaecium TaxID=2898 RepID=F2HHF9_9CRYP|nr:hypothetical protein CPARA_1gp097 [Cryptomonas paramecium]AEA38755.1 hypothetical protein CPARA_1gp097 [Cryptomonas paramecium]